MIEKKLRKKNVTIAPNVLHVKKEKIYPAYILKNNSNRGKQVILVMIPNGEEREVKSKGRRRWNYLAVKNCFIFIV